MCIYTVHIGETTIVGEVAGFFFFYPLFSFSFSPVLRFFSDDGADGLPNDSFIQYFKSFSNIFFPRM